MTKLSFIRYFLSIIPISSCFMGSNCTFWAILYIGIHRYCAPINNPQVDSSFLTHLDHFLVIGSNFTKANTQVRSRLAITKSKTDAIYVLAAQKGLKDFLILSTCNRTEFYASSPFHALKELAVEALNLNKEELDSYFYTHSGMEAVRHFSKVVAGLDSQIIGDYEIVGQVKAAIQLSRDSGLVGTLLDRISNYAFQASKEIKAKTNLSNGKYSVSHAAAELINSQQNGQSFKNILIVGTGEIGQAMARNLKEYFPQSKLSLTNRTHSHAQGLALELNAEILPFENFTNHLSEFDVVITTAESDHYLIQPKDIPARGSRLLLDLSIPQVIDPQIKNLPQCKHYSVDEISTFHNELMQQRYMEIPKAEQIIEEFIDKLMVWQAVFQHTGVIMNYKEKMGRIIHNGGNPAAKIEKSFSGLIQQIKSEGYRGCAVIQTVNELIALER
jgi:glutamyl-tRNA reductase